jgi:hypothetical protein
VNVVDSDVEEETVEEVVETAEEDVDVVIKVRHL